jgi:3-dehydroquinate synthase II
VIPAENLVALFQGCPAKLLAAATSAEEARVMLEALETGTAGVLLRTEDPMQVL